MEAFEDAGPDPEADDPRRAAVRVRPVRRLARPVTLAEIKAAPVFADWELVRISRLSVMPSSFAFSFIAETNAGTPPG